MAKSKMLRVHVVTSTVHSHRTGYDYKAMIAFLLEPVAYKHAKDQQDKINKVDWLEGQVAVQSMDLIETDYKNTFDLEHFEDDVIKLLEEEEKKKNG